MRNVLVTPRKTFKDQGILFLSTADGGQQLFGVYNAEKKTVDFHPPFSPFEHSIPFDRFEENVAELYVQAASAVDDPAQMSLKQLREYAVAQQIELPAKLKTKAAILDFILSSQKGQSQ